MKIKKSYDKIRLRLSESHLNQADFPAETKFTLVPPGIHILVTLKNMQ